MFFQNLRGRSVHDSATVPARRAQAARGLAGTAAALLVLTALPLTAAQAADAPAGTAGDGKSSETAAASCWEIKQLDPSSKSGSYWLWNPKMPAPQQFYCDQETDGGGWVMVGRGREGWKETYAGYGSADAIASTPTGPGAFHPAQLPSQTVDALLNGQKPQDLPDGIRLNRALNQSGSQMQDVRFNRKYSPRWTWTFRSETPVKNVSFTNPAGSLIGNSRNVQTGTTATFGDSLFRANYVQTTTNANNGWNMGFGYPNGTAARSGSTSPSSYIWANGGNSLPFTQMYLRPKVMQSDLTKLATDANGTYAASARRDLPNSYAEKTQWGAVGRANGRTDELNVEVQDFAQVGNTMFVGGNFQKLQSDAAGSQTFDQPYVAGLDVNTLQPVRTFMPQLNGQVKSLHEVDGKLAIGGEFTTVNGKPHPGFVVVDPTTGQIDPAWENTTITDKIAGETISVRAMDVHDGYLYLGGLFTHGSGPKAKDVYAHNAMRIKIADQNPDRAWNPNFNGTVVDLSVSDEGAFAAGYFNKAGSSNAFRLAALNLTDGKVYTPWNWRLSYNPPNPTPTSNYGYQLSVKATEDGHVWAGGSEHILHAYDTSTLTRLHSSITRNGGDFQSINRSGENVFGSCHCGDWNFQDGQDYKVNDSPWTVADQMSLIGAYDRSTGDFLPEFNPQLKGPGGFGVWANTTDTNGVLWAGGSIDRSQVGEDKEQWSYGFVRFARRDITPPSVPGNLKAAAKDGKDQLTWAASGERGVTYQVIRDGRVIGSTKETSASFTHVDGASYAVRAMDSNQNYSESSAQVQAAAPAPAQPAGTVLAKTGDVWEYQQGVKDPGTDWNQPNSTDTAGWSQGSSALGWGAKDLGTTLVRDASNPLTTYYRKTVNLEAGHGDLTLNTYADDGVILYVNGKEVNRTNMPEGKVTAATHASVAVRTAAAKDKPIQVTVPAAELPESGEVVIAAEVHGNWRTTTDSTFDLTAQTTASTQAETKEK